MFKIALNTSTLRNWDLSLEEKIDIVAKAGYDGIEPWLRELVAFQEGGGRLEDIRDRLSDNGIAVIGAVGFIEWAAGTAGERQAAYEQARRETEIVARIGGKVMAAPPSGRIGDPSLDELGERYAAYLTAVGDTGVTPVLELWGHCPRLFNMSELLYVASAVTGNEVAVLLDTYHLYKGGTALESLALISGHALGGFHANDYPGAIPRNEIADRDRVFPGDGAAPLGLIYKTLRRIGYDRYLSLELFRDEYGSDDPLEVARTGFEKTDRSMREALGS